VDVCENISLNYSQNEKRTESQTAHFLFHNFFSEIHAIDEIVLEAEWTLQDYGKEKFKLHQRESNLRPSGLYRSASTVCAAACPLAPLLLSKSAR
jgi:hypothetical protein